MKKLSNAVLAASLLLASASLFGKGKTLIELSGGKPTSALAKSWKKTGAGKYDFVLDTAAEIAPGKKLNAGLVKSSLEDRLSASGVKVTVKGPNAISVGFTGSDKDFLEKISKTRIKASADVEVALEGSGSEGGIRAKTSDRPPAADEIKGVVVSASGTSIELRVSASSKTGDELKIAESSKIKINLPPGVAAKKGEILYVKPTKLNGDTWEVSAATKI